MAAHLHQRFLVHLEVSPSDLLNKNLKNLLGSLHLNSSCAHYFVPIFLIIDLIISSPTLYLYQIFMNIHKLVHVPYYI